MPFTVPLDGNITIIDQDGTHVPSTPLLPLFIAADIVHPLREKPFDWPSVDVVANRNSLRKLLGWANGTERWDFRIDVELAGERTILLNRWVESVIVDVNPRSYGHNFEEESTVPVPGCEQSIRHLRIIKYVSFIHTLELQMESVHVNLYITETWRFDDGGSFRSGCMHPGYLERRIKSVIRYNGGLWTVPCWHPDGILRSQCPDRRQLCFSTQPSGVEDLCV